MLVLLRLLFFVALVALVVWLLYKSYTWKLTFAAGRLVQVEGKIPADLRHAFIDVAESSKVTGSVSLYGRGTLEFSRHVTREDRQRFRNVFFIGDRAS